MATEIHSGKLIADFRVERMIGAGAMGTVYLAEDVHSGTQVALKVLAPELARDARFRERFLRESQIAARLDHPNLIRTIASGDQDGLLYLAMAYADGPDLREILRRDGRLDAARTVTLVAQVAPALDEAHRAGLVHRDVKPGNILVASRPDGEHAYVCDFGLARHVSSVSSLTGERGFVGTIDYVPPEQIEGGKIDGRADVYSLGCVLFELLTGERPFERDSELSVVFAHLNDPPPQITALSPELPTAFDDVVATALAKSPDERYSTCGELAEAAQAALHGKSFRTRRRPSRRLWAAAAAVLAAAVASGAILAAQGGGTRHAAAPALPLRANAVNLISARTRAVVGHVSLGRRSSEPFAVFDVVRTRRAAWVLDAADQRLLRIDLASRRRDRTVRLPWQAAGRIAVGGGFAWATQDGGPGIVGVDERTGRIAHRFNVSGGNGVGIAFGDGSRWLAQGTDVARIDPRTGRVLDRIVTRPGQQGTPHWRGFADCSVWTASADDGVIRKIDPVTNRVVAHNTLHGWVGDLAVGDGNVWVPVAEDGSVFELNEDDLSIAGTRAAGS